MTRNKFLIALTAAIGTLTIGATALAGPGGGGPEHGFMQAVRNLELTDAQKASLQEIRSGHQEGREEHRAEMEEIGQAYRAEMIKDSPNAATLHTLTDRRLALQAEGAHERVDRMLEVHAVLTPEQRAEVMTFLDERRDDRQERREGFRDGGDDQGEGPRGRGGRHRR